MIDRIIRASLRDAPARGARSCSAGAAIGALWLQDLRRDVFPGPVGAGVQRDRAERGDGRRGARDRRSPSRSRSRSPGCPTCAASARTRSSAWRRSRSSSSPTPTTTARGSSSPSASPRRPAQLPPGTEPPLLSSLTGRLNEIFEFTLEAEAGAADLMTLRDLAEFEVKNRLLAVPGVAAVERLGGYLRQFQVQLDPERMSARGVSLDEVLHAVEESNLNASGGFVAQGPMEWTVRAVGRAATRRGPARHGRRRARRRPGAARRRRRRARGAGGAARHRAPPRGEVVSAARDQAVRRRHGAGRRRACAQRRRGHPPRPAAGRAAAHRLRPVASSSTSALGGVGRAVLLGGVFVVLVSCSAARQRARGADRHADDPALDRARRPAAAAAGRRPQHDDARRARDRGRPAGRRGDHRGREHPAPARAARRRAPSARERAAGRGRRGRRGRSRSRR